MNTYSFCIKLCLIAGICIGAFACAQRTDQLPAPRIQQGVAKVSGKIVNYHPEEGKENPVASIWNWHSVTAENCTIQTHVAKDGSFHLEVSVETDLSIARFSVDTFSELVNLVSGKETTFEITYDKGGNSKLKTNNSFCITPEDAVKLQDEDMWNRFYLSGFGRCYDMDPDDYSRYAMGKMKGKLKTLIPDSMGVSENARQYILNECKLLYLKGCLLDYGGYISLNYRNFKSKEEPEHFTPKEPDHSYYTFLKYFDLNSPLYLYNTSYSEVLKGILSNDALHIPPINDIPIQEWMKEVKQTMADLIGSDKGLFYDMLAATAYSIQLSERIEPLSEKQKANIESYFENKEITKILLAKNAETIKQKEDKTPTVIQKTPELPKEKLMDAIVSKYKGKVIVVDFWATWCAPCREAMKKSREMKGKLKDKNVVFVYVTSTSSPQKIWAEQIKAIGGEHYYLTGEEWGYLLDSFHFDGIPTYLIYDTNGQLKDKVTAYPGNEKMQQMIEKRLGSE